MIEHLTPEEHPTSEEAAVLSGLPQWAPEELLERLYQKDRIVQANRSRSHKRCTSPTNLLPQNKLAMSFWCVRPVVQSEDPCSSSSARDASALPPSG